MGNINLRLPDDLHQRAKAAAEADDRSLNSWIISVIRRTVEAGQPSNDQQLSNGDSPSA